MSLLDTFFLQLPNSEDHIDGASVPSEATLALRDHATTKCSVILFSKIRARIFPAILRREMPL